MRKKSRKHLACGIKFPFLKKKSVLPLVSFQIIVFVLLNELTFNSSSYKNKEDYHSLATSSSESVGGLDSGVRQ